jgi:hypothetical protein
MIIWHALLILIFTLTSLLRLFIELVLQLLDLLLSFDRENELVILLFPLSSVLNKMFIRPGHYIRFLIFLKMLLVTNRFLQFGLFELRSNNNILEIWIKSSNESGSLVIGQYGKECKCFSITYFSNKFPLFLEITGTFKGSPLIEQMLSDIL